MDVSHSLNDFSLDLFNHLRTKNPDSNVLISPVSIMTALSMTLLGAKGNTEKEMVKALRLGDGNLEKWHALIGSFLRAMKSGATSAPSPMNVANKIFIDKNFDVLQSFTGQLEKHYNAKQGSVNFRGDPKGAVDSINSWVKEETKDKIPKLLDQLDSSTQTVLVNAVHFKGFWKKTFAKDQVFNETFHISPSKTMEVKMMYQKSKVPFSANDDAIAIRMPFKEEGYSMHFILPIERFGLKALEDKLLKSRDTLNELLLRSTAVKEVEIYIPKFKMRNQMDLIPDLQALGMKDLFDATACDLSGISGDRDLKVSSVIHEATLDVTEEGAEAAAATAVAVTFCMAPDEVVFYADHPFLISITFKDSVLFLGQIAEPKSE